MGRRDKWTSKGAGSEKTCSKTSKGMAQTSTTEKKQNRNGSSRGLPPSPSHELYLALRESKLQSALSRCIDHPEDMLYVIDSNGYSMLHFALERYQSLNARGRYRTDHVSDSMFVSLVEQLLQANPDALSRVCKPKGYTPLHVACCSCQHPPTIKLLLDRCPPDADALHTMFQECRVHLPLELTREIVSYMPNPALMQDKQGKTPLFLACQFSKNRLNRICGESLCSTVTMLVRKFPEAKDIVDHTGRTPLEVVKQQRKFLELTVLLE